MKRYLRIAALGIIGLIAGCRDEEPIKMTGDIVGFVKLFDEDGVELADHSGVTVSLTENVMAETDKIGRFEFRNMEPGTFKLEYRKTGFSTSKTFNFIFVGGTKPAVISNINLIALPQIEVTSKNISASGNDVTVSGTMTTVSKYYFRYYLSDKPDVSFENYVSSSSTSFCCGDVSQFQHRFYIYSLTSPVYVVAYAMSAAGTQGDYDYYDYEKGLAISPAGKKLFEPVKLK